MASAPLGITDPVVAANAAKLAQSRNVQYKYASKVSDAILGNLGTTSAGIGRTLTDENSRQATAIKQMMARNTATAKQGLAGVRQYAGSMGVSTQNDILGKGAARAAAYTGAGATEAASTMSQAGKETSSLMQQTIAGMGQANQADLISALSARAQADTKTLLDEQFQVNQAAQSHQDTIFNMRAEILNRAVSSGQYTQEQLSAMGASLGAGLAPDYQASLLAMGANAPAPQSKFGVIEKTTLKGDINSIWAGIAKGEGILPTSAAQLGITKPITDWPSFVNYIQSIAAHLGYTPQEEQDLYDYASEQWMVSRSLIDPKGEFGGGSPGGGGGGGGYTGSPTPRPKGPYTGTPHI